MAIRLVSAALSAALFLGCGGDGDSGGGATVTPHIETSVPEDRALTDLTVEEQLDWCDAVRSDTEAFMMSPDVKEGACRYSGVAVVYFAYILGQQADTEMIVAQCTETYDACKNGQATTESPTQCSPSATPCSATVGEFEACFEASLSAMTVFMQTMPRCGELTGADIQENLANVVALPEPAQCATLRQQCPEWFAQE